MDTFDIVQAEEEQVFTIEGQDDDDSDDSPEERDDVRDLFTDPLMLENAQVNPMRRSSRNSTV